MSSNGTRHLLKRQDCRKLEDWVSLNWDKLQSTRSTKEDAAKQASATLGFPVTKGNMAGAAAAMVKKWITFRGIGISKKPGRYTMGLARAIEILYIQLGSPLPDSLSEIIREGSEN